MRAALQPEPNPSLNSSPSLHLNPSPTKYVLHFSVWHPGLAPDTWHLAPGTDRGSTEYKKTVKRK